MWMDLEDWPRRLEIQDHAVQFVSRIYFIFFFYDKIKNIYMNIFSTIKIVPIELTLGKKIVFFFAN